MKKNHCREKCKSYNDCIKPCHEVEVELRRAMYGDIRNKKNKHRIPIIYEHQMDGPTKAYFNNIVYSGIQGEEGEDG